MAGWWRRAREAVRRELRYMRSQVAGLAERDSAQRFTARQIGKATLAAMAAWWVADRFLPPATVWVAAATAVIMVHATVYRTLTNGLRRVAAVAAGITLAGSIGHLLGLNALSLLLVVPPALIAARWHRMGRHGTDVATTAVLLLSYGAASKDRYLAGYLLATAIGAAAGAVINTVLWPPLYKRRPSIAMRRLGREAAALLGEVAAGLRDNVDLSDLQEWENNADRLDRHMERAATAVAEQAESHRYNFRHRRAPAQPDHAPTVEALDQIGLHIHAIVRTLNQLDRWQRRDTSTRTGGLWISPEFGCDYADLLDLIAELITNVTRHPDNTSRAGALLTQAREQSTAISARMTDEVRAGELDHPRGWAASGSLHTDAERILTIISELVGPKPPATAQT